VENTKITFLGTATVVPAAGHDTASFIINGRHLVDAGWYSPIKMLSYGFNPMNLESVFISHCHHDHYMALPQVLFYLRMRRNERPERPPLKVVGPAADIQRVIDLSRAFLQTERFPDVECIPEVFPLKAGDSLELGDFLIETCGSLHPVDGLCYRFTNKVTQSSFVYTGDTAFHPPIADHAKGVSLLIHEASHGPNSVTDTKWGHCGAPEAARIAEMAGVKSLALIHCPENVAEKAVAVAQGIFPNTFLPKDGQIVEI
jgi:ribonuclease Z